VVLVVPTGQDRRDLPAVRQPARYPSARADVNGANTQGTARMASGSLALADGSRGMCERRRGRRAARAHYAEVQQRLLDLERCWGPHRAIRCHVARPKRVPSAAAPAPRATRSLRSWPVPPNRRIRRRLRRGSPEGDDFECDDS